MTCNKSGMMCAAITMVTSVLVTLAVTFFLFISPMKSGMKDMAGNMKKLEKMVVSMGGSPVMKTQANVGKAVEKARSFGHKIKEGAISTINKLPFVNIGTDKKPAEGSDSVGK